VDADHDLRLGGLMERVADSDHGESHIPHLEPQNIGRPTDEALEPLLRILPGWIQDGIAEFGGADLEEITIDLGRLPSLRSRARHRLISGEVSRNDLHYIIHRIHGFRDDNRTGIDRTLHRIACVRDRHGLVVGLTIRVGRALVGIAEIVRDLLLSRQNLLVVGPPGCGKTALLRDATRILASRWDTRVIVVDTSNEIGGEGRMPHPSLGSARRIQTQTPSDQARILMQTVANHGPQVIIVDEIGFQPDVAVVLTIAHRGVQLLAAVHGHGLDDIMENPDLAMLVGGVASIGHLHRHRIGSPAFALAVEVRDHHTLVVHRDVAQSVDELCAGRPLSAVEIRVRSGAQPISPSPIRLPLGADPSAWRISPATT